MGLSFFLEGVKDHTIGSLVPTSKHAAKLICDELILPKEPSVHVEFGPGDGAVTKELLNRIGPQDQLIAVESSLVLMQKLEQKIRDSRLKIVHALAQQALHEQLKDRRGSVANIVSGIPFSQIGEVDRAVIFDGMRDLLDPEGHVVIYQFLSNIKKELEERFDLIKYQWTIRNIPPLYILTAEQKGDEDHR